MGRDDQRVVLSVSKFTDARLIDGGDTVTVFFEAPDGRQTAILIPRQPASELQSSLVELLAVRPPRNPRQG